MGPLRVYAGLAVCMKYFPGMVAVCLPSSVIPGPGQVMDEHLTPNTQLSVLEQSQPIEFVIVIKSDDEAKLAELEEQVASLQRKAADSSRCKVAKQLRTQLAEARAEVEAHEAQRFENCAIQQQQVETLNISLVVASKQLTRAKANHAKLTRRSSLRRASLVIASRRLEQQQLQLDQAHAALSKTGLTGSWAQARAADLTARLAGRSSGPV